MALRTYFAAERIKLRRSWVMVAAILAPLCQVLFLAVIFWFSESRVRFFKPGFQFWIELNTAIWNVVIMPLTVGLVCELSWDQEREARAFNHLLAQPAPRRLHFQVKALTHLVLLLLALGLFAALVPLVGQVFTRKPQLFMGSLPLPLYLRFMSYSALALVPPVVFHTWLAMRLPGLWLALASALAGSWGAMQLVGVGIPSLLLPWGLAAQASQVFERWRTLPWSLVPGAFAVAGAILILGARDFSRHRESRN